MAKSSPVKSIRRTDITAREPFVDLFPVQSDVVNALAKDMRAHGFNPAHPLVVWPRPGQSPTLIDGHMRITAAGRADIADVPVVEMDFPDERAALEWAFQEQAERRRNLTRSQAQTYFRKAILALDSLKPRGGDVKSTTAKKSMPSQEGIDLRSASAKATAKLVGTSKSTVERVRFIEKHGDAATKAAVADGSMTLTVAQKRIWAKQGKLNPHKNPRKPTAPTKPAASKNGGPDPNSGRERLRAALAAVPESWQGELWRISISFGSLTQHAPAKAEAVAEAMLAAVRDRTIYSKPFMVIPLTTSPTRPKKGTAKGPRT
jgi:hypothetical protein